MFGFFNKKPKGLVVRDRVWITEAAKFNACLELKRSNPETVFVAWFEETRNNLETFFHQNGLEETVHLADRLSSNMGGGDLIFVEHHPLRTEEESTADKLGKQEITVFSALSEPIFLSFGGGRIVDLMVKMGAREDEALEHSMISKSIQRAQEKIAGKFIINSAEKSQGDWLLNAGFSGEEG